MRKSPRIKQESKAPRQEEDKELAEWAKKLLTKPTLQIGVQQSTVGLAPIFGQQVPADPVPANSGFDRDSAIGRFSWVTIAEEKNVPSVFRNKDEYVAIRMAEIFVIGDLLNVLPAELYESAKIVCHYATAAEAKLLTYVNSWHCDGFYGPDPFTVHDLMISLKDLQTFHDFLYFAFGVLHSGGKNFDTEYKHCGFIKVNSDSLIPYTVVSPTEKGVPLFYFEGQTDILKEKAKPLTGWPLAYLKVCCKVQGVRKDLISGPTLQIVTLGDLQAYFPKRTTFVDKCWPSPKPKSLLPKQSLTGAMNTPLLQVTSDRWTKLVSNETFPNYTAMGGKGAPALPNSATTTATAVVMNNTRNGVTNVTLSCNGVPTSFEIPKSLQTKSPALQKIKISTPPIDKSRLMPIAEHPGCEQEGAYVVRLIIVEKELMHCINAHPTIGRTDDYLILLQEFMKNFFPGVSIYPTAVSVLRNMAIITHLPNRYQIKALNNFGFQIQEGWQMPLIPAQEASQAMAKLKLVFKPRPVSNSHVPVTSSRVSNGGNYQATVSRR